MMAWKTEERVKLDHLLKDFGVSTKVSQVRSTSLPEAPTELNRVWLITPVVDRRNPANQLIGSCSHYLQDLNRLSDVSGGERRTSSTINSRFHLIEIWIFSISTTGERQISEASNSTKFQRELLGLNVWHQSSST